MSWVAFFNGLPRKLTYTYCVSISSFCNIPIPLVLTLRYIRLRQSYDEHSGRAEAGKYNFYFLSSVHPECFCLQKRIEGSGRAEGKKSKFFAERIYQNDRITEKGKSTKKRPVHCTSPLKSCLNHDRIKNGYCFFHHRGSCCC